MNGKEKNMTEMITLNNGLSCPLIGIGTFMLSPMEAENSVREALKMGYRLIDTANAYVNERAVGRGMRDSGVEREEIFLSTKLWPSEYENENAVYETLERLGVIPGRKNVVHIRDNLDVLDFTLTDDEMAKIAKLDKGVRYYNRTDAQLAGFAAWQPTYERK